MKITVRETKMAYVVAEGGHALVGFLKKDDKAYNPLSEVFLRKKLINPHARIARSIAKERGGKAYLKRKRESVYDREDAGGDRYVLLHGADGGNTLPQNQGA